MIYLVGSPIETGTLIYAEADLPPNGALYGTIECPSPLLVARTGSAVAFSPHGEEVIDFDDSDLAEELGFMFIGSIPQVGLWTAPA